MKPKGFTLIELIVAIVIIGILVTAATVNYEKVRAKSRDAKRKIDLANIAIALDSYYSFNKRYPGANAGCDGRDWGNYHSRCTQPWIPNISDYLDPIPTENGPKKGDYTIYDNPCDKNDLRVYQYRVKKDTFDYYHLISRLELDDKDANRNSDAGCNVNPVPLGSPSFTTNITGYPIYALAK